MGRRIYWGLLGRRLSEGGRLDLIGRGKCGLGGRGILEATGTVTLLGARGCDRDGHATLGSTSLIRLLRFPSRVVSTTFPEA